MPSTFTENTGIELIADGEQSGLWGQTTNDNFEIVDRALNGSVNISLSGTTHTLTTASGVLSDGQFAVLVFTGSPSGTNTVTIEPNTAQKTYFVTNSTAQTVVLSQGTGANVSVPAGLSKIVFTDGAGAGAAVFDITNTLSGTFTGNASTATALQTARTIGGVSFNGTANIDLPGVNIGGNQNTTGSAASLTTARTFTIGATGKTFNGTANVAWSLAEIGVGTLGQQAANNVDINGGTIDGTVIGGSSPAAISGTTGSFSTSVTTPLVTNAGTLAVSATGANVITASTNGTERARIDASGNLLVGKTTNDTATAGSIFLSAGGGIFTRSAGAVLDINRTTSDGTIVNFRKDNTTVGVIGTSAGNIYLSDGARSLVVQGAVVRAGFSTGGNADAVQDLGSSSARWRNLFLSDGVSNPTAGGILTFSTAGSERLRITSTGNVGIGTSSPSHILHVSAASPVITLQDNDSTGISATPFINAIDSASASLWQIGNLSGGTSDLFISANIAGSGMRFSTAGSERLRITSTGNVGIGTSSPTSKLEVAEATNPTISLRRTASVDGNGFIRSIGSGGAVNAQIELGGGVGNRMAFFTNGSERMRIDASGNLLVGTTTTDRTTADGITVGNNGFFDVSRTSDISARFTRRSSDGEVVRFRKDGTTVGSIGVRVGTNLNISGSSTNAGLEFSTSAYVPFKNGATVNGQIDLGSSFNAYKDLYLSGGVYLGGTTSANLLDDYEEGTFTVEVYDAVTGGNVSPTTATGRYTKVGRLVTINIRIDDINTTGMTAGAAVHFTAPFTATASQHTGSVALDTVTFSGAYVVPVIGQTHARFALRNVTSAAGDSNLNVNSLSSGVSDIAALTMSYFS